MKNAKHFATILAIIVISLTIASCGGQPASTPEESSDIQVTNLTDEARDCVECHATETHGIVEDWDGSRHADEAVSCIDCHKVEAGSPLALQGVEDHEDLTVAVSMLVQPSTCAECHEREAAGLTLAVTTALDSRS